MNQATTQAHPNRDQVLELGRRWGKQGVLSTLYEGFCRLYGYDPSGTYRHVRRAQARALLSDDVMPPIISSFIR